MKSLTILCLAVLTTICWSRQPDEGWINLLDGESLAGWTPNFDDQQIEVKDGAIEMLAVKKNLWLVHDEVFTDFELEGEIKAPLENYNTGIAFRCDETPIGYQCEIFDRQSGSLYAIKQGWIFPESKDKLESFYAIAGDAYKPGVWNHYRIKCVGDHIQIWVNGNLTTDVRDDSFTSGRVAIQHHGKGDVHYFRNIRIRSLSD
ncbi:MAG: DUF1080 domain-containing protein [Opitutaceae bacterium]|tara:strand:+ start:6356 stop:6964 length:609 start_codon:yes stop_codon:yes gene_type:complete